MPRGENDDELWDVYDRDRQRTGRTHRRGDPLAPGEYHLVIHLCIFNSKGELLIQKRQPWKKWFPGHWDVSVGGSAVAGDDSRAAAEREAREELGLELNLSNEYPKVSFHWDNCFDDYWLIRRDVDLEKLHLQEDEVSEVRWASREEVEELIRNKQFVPYYMSDKLFEFYHWDDC